MPNTDFTRNRAENTMAQLYTDSARKAKTGGMVSQTICLAHRHARHHRAVKKQAEPHSDFALEMAPDVLAEKRPQTASQNRNYNGGSV